MISKSAQFTRVVNIISSSDVCNLEWLQWDKIYQFQSSGQMNLYNSIAVYPVQDGQFYAKKAPTSSSPGPSPWRILKMSAWHITHSVVICIDHVCGCCVSRQFLHVCISETFRKELPTWNVRLQRHLEQKRPVCRHGDRRQLSEIVIRSWPWKIWPRFIRLHYQSFQEFSTVHCILTRRVLKW